MEMHFRKLISGREDGERTLASQHRQPRADDPTNEDLDAFLKVMMFQIGEAVQAQAAFLLTLSLHNGKGAFRSVNFSPTLYGGNEATKAHYHKKAIQIRSTPFNLQDLGPVMPQLQRGNSQIFQDPLKAWEIFDLFGKLAGFEVQNMLATPIKIEGQAQGMLQSLIVVNKGSGLRARAAFTPEDQALLEDCGAELGKALRRGHEPSAAFTEQDLGHLLARTARLNFSALEAPFTPDYELWKKLGGVKLRRLRVLPILQKADGVIVVIDNPFNRPLIEDFEAVTGVKVSTRVVSTTKLVNHWMERFISDVLAEDVKSSFKDTGAYSEITLTDEDNENTAPLIRLSNYLVEDAYRQGASDIHVEPEEGELVVRYRMDGVLRVKQTLPAHIHRSLISRYKIMAELDIAEHRLPQDGRIAFKKFNSLFDLDLRVSVIPANHGETLVMRILDKSGTTLPLEKLGFSARNLQLYRQSLTLPYGMILHCGPTGSGKSMTLYAALNEVKTPELKILTVEDPVEYTLTGIQQVRVRSDIGLTFASCLRSFLRQDPDIILVGEIRDKETADLALSAALTGHLMFSTLHTNDAASAVPRLVDMGIEPFMISSTLACVCAQRLMRRLCVCKLPHELTQEETRCLEHAGYLNGPAPGQQIYEIKGCPKCDNSGYRGRTGIHELMTINDAIREKINAGTHSEVLKRLAREHGMRTLFEDSMEKVMEGVSTFQEALSTARPDEP